jgi:hypothetical protein
MGAYTHLSARTGQRVKPTDGVVHGLSWNVIAKFGVFSLWISTKPTVESLDECKIGDRRFYINISSVKEER